MNISLVSIPLIVAVVIAALIALVLLPLCQLYFSERPIIRFFQNLVALFLATSLTAAALGLIVNYPMQYLPNTNSLAYWVWPSSEKKVVVNDLDKLRKLPYKDLKNSNFKSDVLASIPDDLEIKNMRGSNFLLKFTAPKSGINKPVMVWLPRGYHKDDGKTYNVFTFLHGYPGTIYGVSTAMEFDKYLQKAIDDHLIPPTIAVIPENNTSSLAPICADAQGFPATTTFLAEDIPLLIKNLYPNVTDKRSGWMVAGTSSGAYCAGRLAVARGDVFGSVAILSGYNPPKVGLWRNPADPVYQQNTLTNLFTGSRPWPLKIYAYSAYYDSDGADLNAQLGNVNWRGGDVLTRVSTYAGGHNWRTWSAQMAPLMRWWGERIKEERWILDKGLPIIRSQGPERVEAAKIPIFSLMGWGNIGIFGIFMLLCNGVVLFRNPRLKSDSSLTWESAFRGGFKKNLAFMLLSVLSTLFFLALLLNRSEQLFPSILELLSYNK